MTWIVTSLCNIILDALQMCFINLSQDFLSVFGINIGSTFPTLASPSSPSFATTISDIGKMSSFFDVIFPASVFRYTIVVLALCLAVFMFIIDLMKAKSATSGAATPLATVVRFMIGVVMILFSYQIFVAAEYVFQRFYIEFQTIASSSTVLNYAHTVKASGDFFSNQSAVTQAMSAAVNTSFNPDNLDKLLSTSSTVAGTSGSSSPVVTSLVLTFICIVALFAIIFEFAKLLLEIVERYVLLGVLYYTSPLGFMTGGSITLSKSFINWVQMVITQFILLMLNSFFVNVFLGALMAMSSKHFSGTKNLTLTTYVAYLLALVAWLKIGQRFDQHLKAMGLSTAQCGTQLYEGMRGGIGSAKKLLKGASNSVGKGKAGLDSLNKASEKTADTKRKANEKAASVREKMRQNNAKKDSEALGRLGKNTANAMSSPNGKTGKEAMSKFMNSLDKDGNRALSKALQKAGMDANSAKLGGGKFSANTQNGGRFSMASSEAYARMSKAEKAGYVNCGAGTFAKATAGTAAESSTMRSIMAAAAAPGVKEAATSWAHSAGYHDPVITCGDFGARVKAQDGRTTIITNTAFNGGNAVGESLGDGYRAVQGNAFRMDERESFIDTLGFGRNLSNGSIENINQAEKIPDSPFDSMVFDNGYYSQNGGPLAGNLLANTVTNGEYNSGYVVQAASLGGADVSNCIPFESPNGTDMYFVPCSEAFSNPDLRTLAVDTPQGFMNEQMVGVDEVPGMLSDMAHADIPVASANSWTEDADIFETFVERDPAQAVQDAYDSALPIDEVLRKNKSED